MTHCERCNIVHVNLECPLCAAKATIEKMMVVVADIAQAAIDAVEGRE